VRTTAIEMSCDVPAAFVAQVHIGSLWKFTGRAFYYDSLFRIKVQQLHLYRRVRAHEIVMRVAGTLLLQNRDIAR
jgi:hypothetical protein